jgi:hypothetical protein
VGRSASVVTAKDQSRADHPTEKVFRQLRAPDLLVLDDFGVRRLSAQSAVDCLAHNAYQVVVKGESFRKRQRPGGREPPRRPAPSNDPDPRRGSADASVLSNPPALGAGIKVARIRWDRPGEKW